MDTFPTNSAATYDSTTPEKATQDEEAAPIITVTNVKLADLPITFSEIKDAVFELASKIQMQDQGFDFNA